MNYQSAAVLFPSKNVQPNQIPVLVQGVGTAVPKHALKQSEILQFILSHFDIQERTRQLYQKTLSNPAIEKRHFALEHLDQVLDVDLDRKNARFEREAVLLSSQSLKTALENAGLNADQLDCLVVATCTGYLCPGLSSHLVQSCDLREDIHLVDLVGMGCGAAIPALEQATNFLRSNPGKHAAVVCTEICSAAMFSNDAIDIIISNTIFADGSAALILNSLGVETGSSTPTIQNFSSLIIPEWRDTLRFRTERGHLKNVLGKYVPEQAAEATQKIVDALAEQVDLPDAGIQHWIVHAGGEKILQEIETRLELNENDLDASRTVLKNYGNMSSPTVLFVLAEQISSRSPSAGEWGLMTSFGAGFSAYGVLIQWA